MKKLVLIAIFIFAQISLAHEFKTKDICSAKSPDICAHIGYNKKPIEKEKFEFTFDIVNKKKAQLVKDVKIQAYSLNSHGGKDYYSTVWTIRPDGHHWDATMDKQPATKIIGVQMNYSFEGKPEEISIDIK